MGSLQDQNVVVVGGSRGVGHSIVEAALREARPCLPPLWSEPNIWSEPVS